MNGDDTMTRLFDRVAFDNEPPEPSRAADAARGQRRLRWRRAATWSTGVGGALAVAAGVVAIWPGDPGPRETPVASPGGDPSADVRDAPGAASGEPHLPGPRTRQLLLETAVEHFDPERAHLPSTSTNAQSGGHAEGGVSIGSKLDWLVSGDNGLGMVQVAVTTPGYADSDDYAREGFGLDVGCDFDHGCTERTLPGTDQMVWVAEADAGADREFSVVFERADGSLVGVGVYRLFGNNSTDPVAAVDLTLEQAFAFVTDPDLRVEPAEAELALEDLAAQ